MVFKAFNSNHSLVPGTKCFTDSLVDVDSVQSSVAEVFSGNIEVFILKNLFSSFTYEHMKSKSASSLTHETIIINQNSQSCTVGFFCMVISCTPVLWCSNTSPIGNYPYYSGHSSKLERKLIIKQC